MDDLLAEIQPVLCAVLLFAIPGLLTPAVANSTAAKGHPRKGREDGRKLRDAGVTGVQPSELSPSGLSEGDCGGAALRPSWTRHPRQATSERPARRYINQVFHDLAGQVATMGNSHEIASDHRGTDRCGKGDYCDLGIAAHLALHLFAPLKTCPVAANCRAGTQFIARLQAADSSHGKLGHRSRRENSPLLAFSALTATAGDMPCRPRTQPETVD